MNDVTVGELLSLLELYLAQRCDEDNNGNCLPPWGCCKAHNEGKALAQGLAYNTCSKSIVVDTYLISQFSRCFLILTIPLKCGEIHHGSESITESER